MPAELLRDVARAGRPIPSRRFSTLPLSIAAHAMVAIVFLLVPLAAEVDLPDPMPRIFAGYMSARPVPAPGPATPARSAVRTRVQNGGGAPMAAPPSIVPERAAPPQPPAPAGLAIEGGLGTGAGTAEGLGVPVAIEPPPAPVVKPPAVRVPLRPGGSIREPKKIFEIAPVYPPLARSGGVEGVVVLEAVINTRGEVERLRVLRSVPLLDGAAIDAVERWRYTPTLLNGIPVPVLITVTVRFALR